MWTVLRGQDLDGVVAGGHPGDRERVWDGITDFETREIKLSKRILGVRAERIAFLHELIHACSSRKTLTPTQEEKFLTDIDNHLLTVLEAQEWT